MISYEISLGFIIIILAVTAQSLNVSALIFNQTYMGWFICAFFPLSTIFFISALAETNRAPFDLPESEAEIVAGYNIEYSAIVFALFFLGEYGNMLSMAALFTCLFLGG
jgi:NADH-quinone oxidoreductase subunit H